ncbi:hypothetical protein F2P56_034460 [Juglans regia]|uniref:TAFII55 protein conserved region domain-containing protein n=1 Tax=Juglans regia TaxID=51240 RepID=A0A833U792_JUGRE|nr:hypothetical protein F2P56_034460 [Juglans regia]
MEEQFILRVPPSIAERLDRLLSESENASSSEDKSLDLTFSEDGRSGTFVIANDHFPASLLDLPSVVESYKTYDDSVLIKTADIGQPELVQRVLKDLVKISAGSTAENVDAETAEQEEDGDGSARYVSKKPAPAPAPVAKANAPEVGTNAGERDRSDSDESDDSI